jgi:hypothetical protein
MMLVPEGRPGAPGIPLGVPEIQEIFFLTFYDARRTF